MTITKKQGRIVVIQGGQWGSEGKGLVAANQAAYKGALAAVRTGSINAGHTVHYGDRFYKMQSIPTAWIVPETKLFIGPGAYIEPNILAREIEWLANEGINLRERLFVDYRCFIHSQDALESAQAANRHHAMGATGKGSSEALIEKLCSRGSHTKPSELLFRNHVLASQVNVADVPDMLMKMYRDGHTILLEGTQGSMLDLHLGHHPFVTNRSCNAAAWFAEAGLPPGLRTEVVLVVRTKPIRSAGNSGPLPNEIDWIDLLRHWKTLAPERFTYEASDIDAYADALESAAANFGIPSLLNVGKLTSEERFTYRVALSEGPTDAWISLPNDVRARLSPYVEKTTVTNKIRRIANLDLSSVILANTWNNASEVVLTFANYEFPEFWNATDLGDSIISYCHTLGDSLQVPITFTSTGPLTKHLLRIPPQANRRSFH